jgi:hypothetical protein
MDAEYFFATLHARVACDGTGRTNKRLARNVSLQNPYEEQIVTLR